jgi:hypothetical protein
MITRATLSTIEQGLPKYRSMLAGNPAFSPYAFESIATVVGDGTSSTITFSSIPSTYQHLQIRFQGRIVFAGGGAVYNAVIRFNSDTGSNYTWHAIRGTGSSVLAYGSASIDKITVDSVFPDANVTSNVFGTAIVDIQDYVSTTRNKTVRAFSGYETNAAGNLWLQSGVWLNTNAITSITITSNNTSNFVTGSVFSLYGIKGA